MKTHYEFDNFSVKHWDEIRAGNIDKTKSYVTFDDLHDGTTEEDQLVTVVVDQETKMQIRIFRDQWGTYIKFSIGKEEFTVAQEDGTRSFTKALISAIGKLCTDIETKEPTITTEIL